MLTIRDLIEQFEIQGKYQIATYVDEIDKRIVLTEGYEISFSKIKDKYKDSKINYMYADDGVLVIEISND
jgi:hypothetical protein